MRGILTSGCGVAVMAKASAARRTKTRLVPPLTFEEAAEFNTAFLRDAADLLLSAGQETALRGYMAYGPTGEEAFFRTHMPEGIGWFESWLPDFGACLRTTVARLFELGHEAACVLNADSPTLPREVLIEAAEALARPGDRAVLGPSDDGGYYLLGLKQAHDRLFEDIRWSTEVVAEQTLARAREIGLPVHTLPTWYDVDDAATLRRLLAALDAGHAAGANPARHTRRLVAELRASADLDRRLGRGEPSPAGAAGDLALVGQEVGA